MFTEHCGYHIFPACGTETLPASKHEHGDLRAAAHTPAVMHDAGQTDGGREQPAFQPGFRLGALDVVVLLVGAVAAGLAFKVQSAPAAIPSYVILTFFLYCNVFRIRRSSELIWAGAFTLLASVRLYLGQPEWPTVFAAGIALTIALIAVEMKHPSYHGIFWRSVNPGLPGWLDRQRSPTP